MANKIARGGAELARRAGAVLGAGGGSVEFAVCHCVDEPWVFSRIMRDARAKERRSGPEVHRAWSETLSSAAFGQGLVVLAAKAGSESLMDGLEPWPASDAGHRSLSGFMGVKPMNPSFLYRGSSRLEMVIELPARSTGLDAPTLGYGLAMGELLRTIGREARRVQRPLLFLQSPTAERRRASQEMSGVPSDDIEGRPWSATGAPAVRFAIAMPPDDAEVRLGVCERIADVAARLGASIEIGDYRLDRRGGSWYTASNTDEGAYAAYVRDRPPAAGAPVTHVMPVTFVGPARVGTTAEIVDRVSRASVPIVAVSVSALENLAFIHLLIGASSHKAGLGVARTAAEPVCGRAQLVIEHILASGVGLDPAYARVDTPMRLAHDYDAGAGPMRPIIRPSVALGARGRAVWAAWQVRDSADALAVVASSLKCAIEEGLGSAGIEAGPGSIDYAVCRRVESGDLRGRMKIALSPALDLPSVRANGHPGELSRGEFCARIEHAWRTQLIKELHSPAVDVEVTWQEERLGRWNALLAGALS